MKNLSLQDFDYIRYAYLHQRADLRVSRGVIPVGFLDAASTNT